MSRAVEYMFDFIGRSGEVVFPASWLTAEDDVLVKKGVVRFLDEPLSEIECPEGCGKSHKVHSELSEDAKISCVVYCDAVNSRIVLEPRQYMQCRVNRKRFMTFAAQGGFEKLTDRVFLPSIHASSDCDKGGKVEIGDASIEKIGEAVGNALVSRRQNRKKGRRNRSEETDSVILKHRDDAKRVVANIKKLHKTKKLSYMKAIQLMRKNPVWTQRMASRSDASWKAACMPSRNRQ